MKTIFPTAAAAFLALCAPLNVNAQTAPAAPASAAAAEPSAVGSASIDGIAVTEAYARSTNPKVGAAFMTISNTGTRDCVLQGAASDAASRTELHGHREENGVMKMAPIPPIELPAGATHALERGGDHVMLMDTANPLAEGDEINLTLDFGTCGTLPLTVRVDNAAGQATGAASHGAAMDHGADGAGSN